MRGRGMPACPGWPAFRSLSALAICDSFRDEWYYLNVPWLGCRIGAAKTKSAPALPAVRERSQPACPMHRDGHNPHDRAVPRSAAPRAWVLEHGSREERWAVRLFTFVLCGWGEAFPSADFIRAQGPPPVTPYRAPTRARDGPTEQTRRDHPAERPSRLMRVGRIAMGCQTATPGAWMGRRQTGSRLGWMVEQSERHPAEEGRGDPARAKCNGAPVFVDAAFSRARCASRR